MESFLAPVYDAGAVGRDQRRNLRHQLPLWAATPPIARPVDTPHGREPLSKVAYQSVLRRHARRRRRRTFAARAAARIQPRDSFGFGGRQAIFRVSVRLPGGHQLRRSLSLWNRHSARVLSAGFRRPKGRAAGGDRLWQGAEPDRGLGPIDSRGRAGRLPQGLRRQGRPDRPLPTRERFRRAIPRRGLRHEDHRRLRARPARDRAALRRPARLFAERVILSRGVPRSSGRRLPRRGGRPRAALRPLVRAGWRRPLRPDDCGRVRPPARARDGIAGKIACAGEFLVAERRNAIGAGARRLFARAGRCGGFASLSRIQGA